MLSLAPRCSLSQRGITFDLGSKNAGARRLFRLTQDEPEEFSTRLDESFRKLERMNTDFVFWVSEELKEFDFEGQIHGLDSERLAVYIDGKRLGAAKLERDVTRTVSMNASGLVLTPGRHELRLSLSRPRDGVPSAEVSWIRLGPPGTHGTDYPSTERQIFAEVTIEKRRNASIILQPGARLRCPVWLPPLTSLRTEAGLWGEGPGELEIAVLTQDGTRHVLANEKREKEDPRNWKPVKVDLSPFGTQLVELEFSAPTRNSDARAAFAEPVLETKGSSSAGSPLAKRVILVLLSGLGHKQAPPQSAENGLPLLNQLAREGTSYPQYRASTTSETGIVASLLTGLPPWKHGVSNSSTRLSTELPALASLIEGNGGRSSFFTGVPPGFENFGFSRGFELFISIPPQKDEAATAPLSQARKWLQEALHHEGPVLSIVQLRGAHPPFDVSNENALKLPPSEYGGDLTPRRAAIQLSQIRQRTRHQQMPEEDWKRLEALQKSALKRQDAALSDLIAWLRQHEAFDDTLFIVAGDVGAGEPPLVPYSPEAPLEEQYLSVPLLIKYPHGHLAGTYVKGYFAPRDITATIAQSLGLDFKPNSETIDLGAAHATGQARMRPHIAFREREYSVRVGTSILRGEDGSAPLLCKPELDPSCTTDRSVEHSLEAQALWLTAWSTLAPPLAKEQEPEKIEPDEELENALIVWGFSP